MILHDPFAMHRRWWDWQWTPTPGVDDAWVDWDYVLADVYQTIQDYTNPETGALLWYDQSGDVWWDVESTLSGSSKAIEEARDKRKMRPGESLYAVPVFDESKPRPTLESWASDVESGVSDLRPSSVKEARPPTAEELAKMRQARGLVE